MAVPRTRLGGPFGGPSLRTRNELDLAPLLDSVGRFATTSIQNAYLRKRQQKQDEQVAREKAEAAALAEQQRQERVQMADRAYQLQLRRLNFDEQQAATKAAAEAAKPKPPVRGTPEYEAALEREAKIRAKIRARNTRSGTTPLDRQIDQARRDVPRIRPIGARERVATDPLTGQQQLRPPLDPGAAQSFVQDSTQKATRLRSLLQQRGDLPPDTAPPPAPPPVDPMAEARARHTQEIREIRARNGSMDEIKAANDRFRSALMGQPAQAAAPTLPPGMQPTTPLPAVTPADKARAMQDPDFAKWLDAQGIVWR